MKLIGCKRTQKLIVDWRKGIQMLQLESVLFVLSTWLISWVPVTDIFKCGLLPDGKYQLKYTYNSNETPSKIVVENGRFSQYRQGGVTLQGEIVWIYECQFQLKYDGSSPDTSGHFSKLLFQSFGEPCIELQKSAGDTIYFRTTYTGNLHITINKGQFVKLK